MNRLWVQLMLMFGLVTVGTFLVVAFTIHYQVNMEFRRFLATDQLWDSGMVQHLTDYYAQHGSWDGVEHLFATRQHGPPAGAGHGAGQGLRMGQADLLLTDASGIIIYDESDGGMPDRRVSHHVRSQAVPIQWQGRTVGYLLKGASTSDLPPRALSFLDTITTSLLQMGLIIGGVGLLLGLMIARSLSAPLARLEAAARRISQGALDSRVPATGTREIASVARAFNDMAASLQRDHELRRTMVADIAHELRTPISVLQGNIRAILDDVYPLEKAEIATIYDETLLLSRLVNDLRELAQAEAGQLSLNMQPTDIKQVIERSTMLFADLVAERGIAFATVVPDTLPPVQGDPDRLQQVVYNLLSNALRHTPQGGSITLCAEHGGTLPAGAEVSRQTVRVAVRDSGSGIAAEHIPHVFERFWRADKSRSREHGGSGLGLAITRHLVEAQGGSIGVESEVGHGSCFWFVLPLWGGDAHGEGGEPV
jgi:two-component system OmpR family sensor kinase/two-component system sensor histidine kinase BaeS